ncbi:hypothetical protein C7974DRAFT_226623 [Boeremia exigua]|uniref:uncharacterized protein n=1 Tax=Boeremia exigua TaxID=749465 RepID=UPI001E8CC467|nr:uncharacterized protein C7974DRAFT_226623 [Boeremia exigua]KAH6620122.1 hypothetical protein C7974DRAFT_226623 [Boeremia exigua]
MRQVASPAISTPLTPPSCLTITTLTTLPEQHHATAQPKIRNDHTMQATTTLVNAHSSCPKCGATIDGDNKSCGSCGSSCPV